MTVEASGLGRIKVVLSGADSQSLGISFKTIDCKKPQTRLLLRAIFRAASEKLHQCLPDNRLLIEAYPLGTGGVLYFTPLAKEQLDRLKLKAPTYRAYDFSDGGDLLAAIEKLYGNPKTRGLKSKIYDLQGKFRLVIEATLEPNIALEFCEASHDYERVKKYTCERAIPLTGDFAILEIGSKL